MALAATHGGRVTEVSVETGDDDDDGGAADRRIAYDVEVAKADGSVVDAHLDKAFTVLGTAPADEDR